MAHSIHDTPLRPSIHAAESKAVPTRTAGGARITPRAHQMNMMTAKAAMESAAPKIPTPSPA